MLHRFPGRATANRPSLAAPALPAALAALLLVALGLAGCASFPPDGGFAAVEQLARERTGHAPARQRGSEPSAAVRSRVAELLRQPLSADAAVEVALLNHRGLQAAYAGLGIAEADLVRAGRPATPSLSFGRLAGGGAVEIDRALLFDLLGLLALPAARQVEQARFEQAQLQAADETVAVAAEARLAFFEAVAAAQQVGYFGQVHDAAEAASELARRMAAAGNFSTLARLREQSFHADAVAQLARARQQALAARERLLRALGLAGEPAGEAGGLQLPPRLPELPAEPLSPRDAEQTALAQRLDVRRARRATEATAQALGLTQATRFVDVLQAGYQDQAASGEPRRRGVEVTLELPLFDFGGARVARAEAVYLQSLHRTAAIAVQARSEVRESHAAYLAAHALARHYRDEVVPLRRRISEENLLRYNGMLLGVFDLLADAREQVAAVAGAVQSLRDFWVAETNLQTALTGRSPAGAATRLEP